MKSANVGIAQKQYKRKIELACMNYERIFRIQLMYELSKIAQPTKDPISLTELKRQFPSEMLMHKPRHKAVMDPKEKQYAEILDSLIHDNFMMELSKRDDLYKAYHHISSAYHIFNDIIQEKNLDFTEFDSYVRNLIRSNINLHNRVNNLLMLESQKEQIVPTLPEFNQAIIRTQAIVDSSTANSNAAHTQLRLQTLSALSGGMVESNADEAAERLANEVSRLTPGASGRITSSSELRVEREMLLQRLRAIADVQVVDTNTLKREVEEAETERRILLEKKRALQTAISASSRPQTARRDARGERDSRPQTARADELNATMTRIDNFEEIVARNRRKLEKLQLENAALKDRVYQLRAQKKNHALFTQRSLV